MYIIVEIVGIIGFPIPLSVPPIISFIPQMKYVLDTRIIFCLEYIITSGVVDIMDDNSFEKNAESDPNKSPQPEVRSTALITTFLTLSKFFAPTFYATLQVTVHK